MAEVPPFLWADAGTFSSPHAYKVPGSGEVQPYTATATYVNASGQAILPALRLKSATGNLLALVFPSTTIADSTSSEVSFVPPFGSAAVSAAPVTSGVSLPTAQIGQFRNAVAGSPATIIGTNYAGSLITNTTIYTLEDSNTALGIHQSGLYQLTSQSVFDDTQVQRTYNRECEVQVKDASNTWGSFGGAVIIDYGTVPPGYVAGQNSLTLAQAQGQAAYSGINNPQLINVDPAAWNGIPVKVRPIINFAGTVTNPISLSIALTVTRMGDLIV